MKSIFSILFAFLVVAMACSCMSCKSSRKSATEPDTVALVGPTFCADSAYAFCAKQCIFGPRLMNTEAHDKCGEWIMKQFAGYGMKVETQDAQLKAWDGTMLRSRNIWARFRPDRPHAYCCALIGTHVRGLTTIPTLPIGANPLWVPTTEQAVWL